MNNISQEQAAQLEQMKKLILRKILTKSALERLGRVRIANPLLAGQLELYLIQVYQSGELKETIDDKRLKEILNVLITKKETKIKRV